MEETKKSSDTVSESKEDTNIDRSEDGAFEIHNDQLTDSPAEINPGFHRISQLLGLNAYDRLDDRVMRRIAFITDWAVETTGSKNLTEIMNKIQNFTKQDGVTFKGKILVDHLYQKIRLSRDSYRLQLEKKYAV